MMPAAPVDMPMPTESDPEEECPEHADTSAAGPADERAALRAEVEEGFALLRQLKDDDTVPFWPEQLLARIRLSEPAGGPEALDSP